MIRAAKREDMVFLGKYDRHIASPELETCVRLRRIFVAEQDENPVGWLRYGLFWDNTPFLNLLFVLESWRGMGFGKALIAHWEDEMRKSGYSRVLTSTQSDESAQTFYRKLGYTDCGALLLPGEPLEILLRKELSPK